MPENYVIITAGGTGARMGTSTPKQFLELNNLPVVMHCINAFIMYSDSIKLIVVLPKESIPEWKNLCEKYQFTHTHEICTGGDTRFQSVKNGLTLVGDLGMVAIHDAARPLLSQSLIDRCFKVAVEKGNAVPVLPLRDSLREVGEDHNHPADRRKFRLVQTPQVFKTASIKEAYKQAYQDEFTDDATVAESIGISINLVDGDYKNVKITNPEDMTLAEAFLGEVN
jgi:2-C-methyl-D-erythritol 4-phosphate cytidylyltransferase